MDSNAAFATPIQSYTGHANLASNVSPTIEPPPVSSGCVATASDFSEYAETSSAVATSAHSPARKLPPMTDCGANPIECTTPSRRVEADLPHAVGERRQVIGVRDVELDDRSLRGQPTRDDLREAELAAERGEHHLGALLLREARDVERDRAVGQDAGDEELLALSRPMVVSSSCEGSEGQWPMPRPPSTGSTAPVMYAAAARGEELDGGGDLVGLREASQRDRGQVSGLRGLRAAPASCRCR